ncbi:MAG: clostripain-related cysteine peptidase [Planctomycetota bacterium]
MKTWTLLLGLVLVLIGLVVGAAEWTFMVYLDGDCDLEDCAILDFLEMATVGSSADVNIVVQFDRLPGYDNSYGNWTDCRRGVVNAGNAPTTAWGASIGEVNMGDPETLREFITWGVTNYPANRYAVVLWNHGGGWRSTAPPGGRTPVLKEVCQDDTSRDVLYTANLRTAMTAAATPMDLIGFDACLMGMIEIAYELRGNGSVMTASEETLPGYGWPYDTILADLAAAPTMTAAQFGTAIATRYGAAYSGRETLSVVDLSRVGTLAADLSAFSATVVTKNTDWGVINDARNAAAAFTYSEYRDLGMFINQVAANAADPDIAAVAALVQSDYAAAVIYNHSGPYEGGHWACGLFHHGRRHGQPGLQWHGHRPGG